MMDGAYRRPDRIRPALRKDPYGIVTLTDTAHVTRRGFILEACRDTAVTIAGGGRWDHIHKGTRKLQVIERNLVDGNPGFVNLDRGDFRLRPTRRP